MQIETFRELLAEVGPLVPFQAITEFDEGPSWVLVVDDETFLLLDWLESTRRVVLHADIGQLPGAGRTAMLGRLLHYNTTNSSIVTGTQAAVRSFATKEHVAHVDEEFAAIANAVDEYTKERGKAEREARLSRKRSGTPSPRKVRSRPWSVILDKAMRKAGIDDKGLVSKPYDEVMRQTSLDEIKLLPIEETVEDDGRERVDSTISVALLVQESEMKS